MTTNKSRFLTALAGVIITTAVVAAGTNAFSGNNWKGEREAKCGASDHDAVAAAIENNDYDAYVSASGDCPMAEKITEENFAKLVEAHQLAAEGKFEEAQAIKEELGMPGFKRGAGRMKGESAFRSGGMGMHSEDVQTAIKNNNYEAFVAAVPENSLLAEKINADNWNRFIEAQKHLESARLIMEELGLPGGPR